MMCAAEVVRPICWSNMKLLHSWWLWLDIFFQRGKRQCKAVFVVVVFNLCVNIWNRMMPKAPVQNQHTRELISVWKTSHKRNSKDLICLLLLTPGMRVNTRHINCTRGTSSSGVYVPCIYSHARWRTAGDLGLVAVVMWCFSSAG